MEIIMKKRSVFIIADAALIVIFTLLMILELITEVIYLPILIVLLVIWGVLFYPLFVSYISASKTKRIDPEDIVGEKCTVIEKIDNAAGCGLVRACGGEWSARSAFDEDVFNEGQILYVVALEGAKLICRKK